MLTMSTEYPLQSIVECSVCFEVPTHVYICKNGHSICGTCKKKVDICPEGRCGYANPPSRNHMVEQILESGYEAIHCPSCNAEPLKAIIYICFNGHSICGSCKERNVTCPWGWCEYSSPPTRNHMAEAILEAAYKEVTCQNREAGCTFNGTKKSMEGHERCCIFGRPPCSNVSPMQDVTMQAWRSLVYLKWECNGRMTKCNQCGFMGMTRETGDIVSNCPYREVSCKHDGCHFKAAAFKIEEHETGCVHVLGLVNCKQAGCLKLGKPNEIKLHEELCDFRLVNCKPDGCSRREWVKYIIKHEDECSNRVVNCKHAGCRKSGKTNEIKLHEKLCAFRLENCKHAGCQYWDCAVLIKEHEDRCSFRLVSCKYQSIGCEASVMVSRIKDHETWCCYGWGIRVLGVLFAIVLLGTVINFPYLGIFLFLMGPTLCLLCMAAVAYNATTN